MPAKFLQGILEMPKTYFTDFMVRPRSGTTEKHRKKNMKVPHYLSFNIILKLKKE